MSRIDKAYISQRTHYFKNVKKLTDVFELASFLNIDINPTAAFGKRETSIKALSCLKCKVKVILVNIYLREELTIFIIAHEIGHWVNDNDYFKTMHMETSFDLRHREKGANMFAADFLLDDKIIESLLKDGKTVYEIARECCVPYDFVIYKLEMMEYRGFELDMNRIPEAPHADCLAGWLGLDSDFELDDGIVYV